MTKHSIFFTMLLCSLRLFAAAENNGIEVVHTQYPLENPAIFISTIQNRQGKSELPTRTVDWAIREFDQGILIGMFTFQGKKDWTGKADKFLQAINTKQLCDSIQTGRQAYNTYGGTVRPDVQWILNEFLNKREQTYKFERALFEEEYQAVNYDKTKCDEILFARQLRGYELVGSLLVAMQCRDQFFLAECPLISSAASFVKSVNFNDTKIQESWLTDLEHSRCTVAEHRHGFNMPAERVKFLDAQATKNIVAATRALAQEAARLGWINPEIKNPAVLGVGFTQLRAMLSQKSLQAKTDAQ